MGLILNLVNQDSTFNLVTGGTTSLTFGVSNSDETNYLYNLSFDLTLSDGMELVSSSIPATSQSSNTYTFINIKDLAPNEQNYEIEFVIKLNSQTSNGSDIAFEAQLTCQLQATADTKPRGDYDYLNEVYSTNYEFYIIASQYTIEKVNLGGILLGESYTSQLIIQTAINADITLESLQDDLGNGIAYLGNLEIEGYSLTVLNNPTILTPSQTRNSYALVWTNVLIPRGSIVVIRYSISANERYYLNGTTSGAYISHGAQMTNMISWQYASASYSLSYILKAMEIMIQVIVSEYTVDLYQNLIYTAYFKVNRFHGVSGLIGYFTATDGQTIANITTPMYTSKSISASGDTQLVFNIGDVAAGVNQSIMIEGAIATTYIRNGLLVYSGDEFEVQVQCDATSLATDQAISTSDSAIMSIHVPVVNKIITQVYYRDQTPKNSLVLAPGDYISYKATYDGSEINAPTKAVTLYDFYPYITKDITQINYIYSSTSYPGGDGTPISPYGNSWYMTQVSGNQNFTLDYQTQIDYTNESNQFLNNLFKIQVDNSRGIAFSNRSQVGFNLGKPNLNLTKTATGNNVNQIKIGETYTIFATLTNQNIVNQTTDAFNMTFTETIPSGLTLVTNSIVAMINGVSISTTVQNNQILVAVDQLALDKSLTLQYQVMINEGLGPNQSFILNSYTSVPYTQPYDGSTTNLLYDLSPVTQNYTLSSQNILLTVTTDQPSKIVGQQVEYYLNITVPAGQQISTMYGLLLLPLYNTYLSQAWLNGVPITAIYNNQMVIFPVITNIDTTGGSISLSYQISCRVDDATVSLQNPLYTLETYYGNLNYTNISGITSNTGNGNSLRINHPYVTASILSSASLSGFSSSISVTTGTTIYTQVTVQNAGHTDAKNISVSLLIPDYLSYQGLYLAPSDVMANYNIETRTLTLVIDSLSAQSSKVIIIEKNVLETVEAQTKLVLSSYVQTYYNDDSTTKVYTTSGISNNVVFVPSLLSFVPLSFYRLTGSNAAINISKAGEETEIKYLVTNIGQGLDSYKIETTPIDYPLDMYINGTFIQSISPQTSSTITSPLLNEMTSGSSRYIGYKYIIPVGITGPCYDTMLVKATSLKNTKNNKTIPSTLQDP